MGKEVRTDGGAKVVCKHCTFSTTAGDNSDAQLADFAVQWELRTMGWR